MNGDKAIAVSEPEAPPMARYSERRPDRFVLAHDEDPDEPPMPRPERSVFANMGYAHLKGYRHG